MATQEAAVMTAPQKKTTAPRRTGRRLRGQEKPDRKIKDQQMLCCQR